MTNDNKQQPYRPPIRSANRYAAFKDFKREITAPPPVKDGPKASRKDIFSMNITASIKGEPMEEQTPNESAVDESQFLIDMIFKPNEPGLRLRPEETQLLLAYIGEILKEIEAEEKLIIKEETASTKSNGDLK